MAALAGILLFLSGCAFLRPVEDPTRLYLLSVGERAEDEGEDAIPGEIEDGVTLGLHRIRIPAYLNRPSIAMVTRANTLQYAVYDRWAESLDRGLGRVVRGNLRQDPLFEMVDLLPGRSGERYDFEVTVFVEACDALLPETEVGEGRYVFHVSWEVMGNEGIARLAHGDFIEEGPWSPGNFSDLARSISLASRNLSRELVGEIAALREANE